MYVNRKCFHCGKAVAGRTDKKFCDHTCRSNYHNHIYRKETTQTCKIDRILKRNRRILKFWNPMGYSMVQRGRLLNAGFDFDYFTHLQEGKGGRLYRFCYEYGYAFMDEEEIELLTKKNIPL